METLELPEPYEPQTPAWMLIFADLLSLLLTFFVLIFSMNAVQVEDWQAVVESLSDRLNPSHVRLREEPWDQHPKPNSDLTYGQSIDYLNTVLEQKIAQTPVLASTRVRLLEDRLAISIPADLLFATGDAKIADPAARDAIADMAAILMHVKNDVAVVGYTDPSPVDGIRYASPWELSLARAMTVAKVLKENGHRRPLPVYGYGGRRFGDLLDDLPPALQSRLSRRVDIVIREYDEGTGRQW